MINRSPCTALGWGGENKLNFQRWAQKRLPGYAPKRISQTAST